MATIEVLAGDIDSAKYKFFSKDCTMIDQKYMIPKDDRIISLRKNNVKMIQQLDEETKKKLAGMAGWGLVGAVALGPLGAVGGMLIGGRKREISFVCEFNDGKKFMAKTDSKTFTTIMSWNF